MSGGLPNAVPTDPTIYRFYEVLQVYGRRTSRAQPTQEFGDGIMRAIQIQRQTSRRIRTRQATACR